VSGIAELLHKKRVLVLKNKQEGLAQMKKETPNSKSFSVRSQIIENLEILTEIELVLENRLYKDIDNNEH
jgi:hypothetical protein